MVDVLQSLMRGLGTGSMYALIAVGFVVVYRSTGVISFTQPGFMVAGALVVSYLAAPLGFWLALPLAVGFTTVLALGVERAVIRPMVARPMFAVALITLGADIVIRVVADAFIGADIRQVGDPWGLATWRIGSVSIQQRHVAMVLTAAVVGAGLFAFLRYSRTGLAMRAVAFDQETALAQGISVGRVFALSWALAGGLAALAGAFVGTSGGIDQASWLIALKALPAIVVGGLDSAGGAVAGGLAVGVVESLVSTYQAGYAPWLGSDFAVVSPYVLMVVVLLVRPHGLFGTREVRRV